MTGKTCRGGVMINILAVLMALEITAVGLLGGYLILTGRIDNKKVWLFSEVYDGRLTSETLAMADKWTQYQQEEAARKAAIPAGAAAPEKLAATVSERQTAQIANQLQMQEITALKKELEAQLQQLRRQREEIQQQQEALELARRKAAEGQDESFQEMLRIMSRMKPPEMKELLVRMDEDTVVKVLTEMDARAAAKVLGEFRTPEEVETKRRYLELINAGGAEQSPVDTR